MSRTRSRPAARPPGRERDAFRTPPLAEDQPHLYIKPSAPFTSGNVHIGPRPLLLDRRRLRALPPGARRRRPVRLRLRRVRPAGGARRDRRRRAAERLGAALREPHDRAARSGSGFSFDWERSFLSSDAIMYRWSQWLFLVLLEAGLVYRGTGTVDWCDNCQTTLASIQVEAGGTCWRCHNPVRLIELPQWYFKVSAYVEENDSAPRRARGERQLGQGGARLAADRAGARGRRRGRPARPRRRARSTVFTPHADAVGQARFVLISPRHPEAERVGVGPGRGRAARAAALGRLGAQRARGRDDPADRHRARRSRPGAARALPGDHLPARGRPLRRRPRCSGVPDRRPHRRGRRGAPRPRRASRRRRAEDAAAGGPAAASAAVRYRAFDFAVISASARGARRSRSSTARAAAPCRCRASSCPVVLPLDIRRPARATRWPSCEEFVNTTCPSCGGPGAPRDRHARLPLRRAVAVDPGVRAAGGARGRRSRRSSRWRTCATGCPPSGSSRARTAATSCSTSGRSRRRCATSARSSFLGRRRALRRLPVPRDGDQRRAQDEQAPRQRRRPRRARRALRRRHGAPRGALRGAPAALAELERLGRAALPPLPRPGLGVHPGELAQRAQAARGAGAATATASEKPTRPSTCALKLGAVVRDGRGADDGRHGGASRCTAPCAT